jgi:inosose dehydratase
MNKILIGCGQITWIRFGPNGAEWLAPEEEVLAQIAQAGYDGAPAGPDESRTLQETLAMYARHRLLPAPGYYGTAFWDKSRQAEFIERAKHHAEFARIAGCDALYVAPGGFDYVTKSGLTRRETAGHVRPEDALTDDEYQTFAETLNLVGQATLAEGVYSCFHNHVGTVIETRAETDRLLAMTDPNLLFLGPDTGHMQWAGDDAVAFCRDHAARIKTVHLKDINEQVRAPGAAAKWDYGTFTDHGIFAELGEGCIDFGAIIADLRAVNFSGWLITETDVTQKATPLESVTISRDYLRQFGL